MSDTKIFSLGDNGGASSNAALIASLCQQRGLDPNMVAAMMNNRGGNGGWGDGSAWWIIILLIFGWGGFGNGMRMDGGRYGNRMGYRDEEDWEDDEDFGERRGRSSRTGRYVRR